ncbi:MAG: hypothetical protein CVU01_03760 [Bacteroidetes bacterium HGW-Bacteroidetes-18]|nr:MAG: hypothetical protein CVU01_03760 [Bacteroidetes bacterium HGW-Bacteroidetes-18]
MKKRLYLLFVLPLFWSCTQNTFDSEEVMWTYLKDPSNGYLQQKTINDINFSIVQRPTDLLVKQELGDSINTEKIQLLREKYNKYIYFMLSMSKNNQELLSAAPKNRNEFGAMVNQLAFGMNEKVHLYTQKKDTIELVDFIYPRMYGMSNATTIMFVFPRNREQLNEDYLNFTIEDLDLYTGEVKFKIPTKNIIKEPKLSFKI